MSEIHIEQLMGDTDEEVSMNDLLKILTEEWKSSEDLKGNRQPEIEERERCLLEEWRAQMVAFARTGRRPELEG